MSDLAPQTLAAIDIGSNSIKLTVARRLRDGMEEFFWSSETVRLGEGMEATGRLGEARMAAATDTLARFAETARELGAERTLAVATEAIRVAANGSEFLAAVVRATGIEAAIVDGDREAALTFAGLAATVDLRGSMVVADIGGASTELIVALDGLVLGARSFPIGSGRLTDRFVREDPPLPSELTRCRGAAAATVAGEPTTMPLPAGAGVRLTLVGGTGEYLGKLVDVEQGITAAAVERVLDRLAGVPASALAVELAVVEARARVLPAGVAIAAAVADLVRPDAIGVARSGIRAGLLLEAFGLVPLVAEEEDDGVR